MLDTESGADALAQIESVPKAETTLPKVPIIRSNARTTGIYGSSIQPKRYVRKDMTAETWSNNRHRLR